MKSCIYESCHFLFATNTPLNWTACSKTYCHIHHLLCLTYLFISWACRSVYYHDHFTWPRYVNSQTKKLIWNWACRVNTQLILFSTTAYHHSVFDGRQAAAGSSVPLRRWSSSGSWLSMHFCEDHLSEHVRIAAVSPPGPASVGGARWKNREHANTLVAATFNPAFME